MMFFIKSLEFRLLITCSNKAITIPISEIINNKKIGLTSGASAPEKLIQDFITEVKKHCKVSIEEVITTEEKVTFKLPRSLS